MPWSENDYPSSWKNLESITRRKAIDMGNAMLKNGYNEGDIIPIVTNQAKEWADQASEADKRKLRQKDITKVKKILLSMKKIKMTKDQLISIKIFMFFIMMKKSIGKSKL